MPGPYTYAIGAWRWDATYVGPAGLLGAYVPPDGSVSVLDYRNDEQQGQPARTDGDGLFSFAGAVPDDMVVLGTGYAPELQLSPSARTAMRQRLGLSGDPIGNTLAEAAVSCFADYGDPSGVSFARPLDITPDGFLEMWLMGHSRVHRSAFDRRQMLAANPNGRANKIRQLWRTSLDKADAAGKLPEALGALLLSCGYSRDEVKAGAKGKSSEWSNLVSAAMKAKHGKGLAPREPHTQLIELWPTNGAITSGQTHPWSEVTATPWASGMVASGGAARDTANGMSFKAARCDTPVSSADHWLTGVIRVAANYQAHLITRLPATNTATCYFGGFYCNGSLNTNFLTKYVTGTGTTLATGANIAPTTLSTAALGKMRSLASAQSFELAGFATLTVTDPAITGNLYGGCGTTTQAADGSNYVGAVTIDDGQASGGGAAAASRTGIGMRLGLGL